MDESDLYAPFAIVDPPLDRSRLPTVDQMRTAYRKQKLRPCDLFFTRPPDYACPLAVLAFARGVPRGNDELVAAFWRDRIGYWNTAWLLHGIDGGESTDVLTDDQAACYRRGVEIRQSLAQGSGSWKYHS